MTRRRATYKPGAGLLFVDKDRLLFLKHIEHAPLEALFAAASDDRPLRSLAAAVVNADFDVPPFVFIEQGQDLREMVFGTIELSVADPENSLIRGDTADTWSHFQGSTTAAVSSGASIYGFPWIEVGIVRAGAFRWGAAADAAWPCLPASSAARFAGTAEDDANRLPSQPSTSGPATEHKSRMSALTRQLPPRSEHLPHQTRRTLGGNNAHGEADVPPGRFSDVSTSGIHTWGLHTDGTIACWGRNDDGQLDVPAGRFSAVSAFGRHSCGLHTDRTIACWGGNSRGQANAPGGSFSAVSAGVDHTCALRTDGTVACWGNNDTKKASPPGGQFSAVSAGGHQSCALRTDDTIACWGNNYYGESDAPAGRFSAVDAGMWYSCGVRIDGTLTCWGENDFGLTDPPAGRFSAVSAGNSRACALRTDGSIACWGIDPVRVTGP